MRSELLCASKLGWRMTLTTGHRLYTSLRTERQTRLLAGSSALNLTVECAEKAPGLWGLLCMLLYRWVSSASISSLSMSFSVYLSRIP